MSGNEHAADGMMLVLCTFPDIEIARKIGSGIIAEGLAACVNLVPQVESIYRWKGEMQSETEVLAIFKLCTDHFPALESVLAERHPYEVPEIIGLAADAVSRGYLDWVLGQTPPC
jgi:periplasmic divalent cation tolerance protein